MKFLCLLALMAVGAHANDLLKAPPSFDYKSAKAVFTDFTHAHYDIVYDVEKKSAFAHAEIKFLINEEGFPIFDSHEAPTSLIINGQTTSADLISTPSHETKVRVLATSLRAGHHVLKVTLPITQLVEFTNSGVKSAFWMSDLSDRGYLERYLPTNFQYDRIPMSFSVTFKGVKEKQMIYTNGVMKEISENETKITYPAGFNVSCLYFHTVPASSVNETRFSYKSLDGRELPVVIYLQRSFGDQSSRLADLKKRVINIMDELEGDYGAFPHPSLTVYVAGSGGMEYSGATMTSVSALGHEIFHSYFARGVMPSEGNAGWIDEALASWRDDGYDSITSLSGTSRMANLGTYTRLTDRAAYSFGERFMALLDGKLQSKGGLKPFLRNMVEKHTFAPLNVPEFISHMNEFYGMSFNADFKRYVFGESFEKMIPVPQKVHPVHKQLTLSELKELL